jgi:pimeloyl-ACP methyl ester carboxylesterase
LPTAVHVYGAPAETVTLVSSKGDAPQSVAFKTLSTKVLEPATYTIRFSAQGEAVEFPPCNVRGRVSVDGKWIDPPSGGPFVRKLPDDKPHDVAMEVKVSEYERRIACGFAPRAGLPQDSREELRMLAFESPNGPACKGKSCSPGQAVVYVPRAHDDKKPAPLLVGVHPWNGSTWTYAAYSELLAGAQDKDMILLFPSGLGNSLYTAPAEDEVMRAIAALSAMIPVDPQRVSIFGASMGGGGATTIGFHRPDHFATITSFFGDAKFDVAGYVKTLLPTEAAAHMVNPIDVIENARHVPLWLIHGEQDKTSPLVQSQLLYAAMSERNYKVKFDKDPKYGHHGALVQKHIAALVELAAGARAPAHPTRVSYKSVRPGDAGAYGVRLVREKPGGDALFDVEYVAGRVRLKAVFNVKELFFKRGAFGLKEGQEPELVPDGPLPAVPAHWEP